MKVSGGLRAASIKTIRTGVAALGVLAFAAQANAADIYAPAPGGFKDVPVIAPVPVWTGFYAGVNAGAAWSNLDIAPIVEPHATSCYSSTNTVSGAGYCSPGRHWDSTNAFGGGQLGYNWQGWGNFVVGLEVDLEGVGGSGERSFLAVPHLSLARNVIGATFKEDGGFAGDVTGRLGYAWGNWLLYAKGGFAWFNPDLSARASAFNPATGLATYSFSGYDNNTTLTGWTVGAGVEWLLNPNWSVKLEYMYYDFALNDNYWNATVCPTGSGSCSSYSSWRLFNNDLTVNTVKLGVNYHLTSSYIPLK